MGYQTDFSGSFEVTPPLSEDHARTLIAFNEERHEIGDGHTPPAGMPGIWCQWVPAKSFGETPWRYLHPDGEAPAWLSEAARVVPQDWLDAPWDRIEWDQGEKFYDYVEWIVYLIDHFLGPWGYTLNGEVYWEGEESGDLGAIVIEGNKVRTRYASVTYSEPGEPLN